jgi:hypothetical protein
MAFGGRAEVPDGVVLDVLDRVERQGQSMALAGAAHQLSRSSVAGLLKRVRDGLATSEAKPVPRGQVLAYWPENKDGGMPARWWQAGLNARAAKAVR